VNLAAKPSKLALLGSYVLREAQWDGQAEEWSRRLPHDWPGTHAGTLCERVESGRAKIVQLLSAGERIGFVVYEIDENFEHPEMILVAAYSSEGRVDVTEMCLPELAELAAREGCATIRFHTMRPGLIAKAQRAGYRVSEVIMRRDVGAVPGRN
jgi:hypothetical protein